VNAAFLLVTSAMLVGQAGGAPKVVTPAPASPAPVVASGCGAGGCGYSCDSSCCDSFGHRLRTRFGGLFHRCTSCNTCDTCSTPTPVYHAPRIHTGCNTCNSCETPRAWTWQRRCHDHSNTGCNTCNTSSCGCGSEGYFDRLRGHFRRNDCNTCNTCNSCGSNGTVTGGTVTTAPPVKGEKIDTAPKKMPVEAPKTPAPEKIPVPEKKVPTPAPGKVMIDNVPAPIAPSAIPAIPVTPRVEVVAPAPTPAPAGIPVPRIEGNPRDPF